MKNQLLLFLALCFYQCSTEQLELLENNRESHIGEQTVSKIERKSDSVYLVSNGRRHAVNQTVITVKLKSGISSVKRISEELRSNDLGYIDIQVPEGVGVEEYVSQLKETGVYDLVEYNTWGEWCVNPNDIRISEQWYIDKIDAPSAWNITMGSSNIKVAIIDSGVDWQHPDLGVGSDGYSNIDESLGWNYITNDNNVITTNGHGTRVAGIVGAKTNNSIGIAGISGGNGFSGITMIPYCVGIDGPDFSVLDDAIIDAVDKGARVINLSLSGLSTSAVTAAVNYATQNNVVVVCASGNNSSSQVSYPASLSNVIAVGAIDKNYYRASFSNYGTNLKVVAPGVDILSTTLNNGYNRQDGTSFAAPQVSAIAALILSAYPDLTQNQVANFIERSAKKVGGYNYTAQTGRTSGVWHNEMGYGLLDAYAALNAPLIASLGISGPSQVAMNTVVTYSIQTPPAGVSISGYSITPGSYTITRFASDRTSLDVKFNLGGQYTLVVRYALPNGGTHTVTKYISVAGFAGTPVVRAELWMDFASFRVDNHSSGVTYQWEVNGNIVSANNWQILVNRAGAAYNPSNAIQPPSGYYPDLTVQARCRASYNGITTDWGNMASVFLRGGNWVN